MARARGVYRQLHCHSCDRSWGAVVMTYSVDWTGDRERPSCTCDHPHVEILRSLSDTVTAQCRKEQRAVYYRMPDGSIENPMTNSYTDPGAIDCAARGGVRYEIHNLSEMRALNREGTEWYDRELDRLRAETGHDFEGAESRREWARRLTVLDWNVPTVASGSAMTPARMRTLGQMQPETRNPDVILGGDYYEEVKRLNRR